jgi:hypothetical protein
MMGLIQMKTEYALISDGILVLLWNVSNKSKKKGGWRYKRGVLSGRKKKKKKKLKKVRKN